MFCCIKNCFNGVLTTQNVPLRTKDNLIQLDTSHMGHEVVIVKNGLRVCGSGGVLATAPLVQSKSYFEVKLQQGGNWSIGLGTRDTDLNATNGGTDKDSWCLNSDNIIINNNKQLYELKNELIKNNSINDTNDNDVINKTTNLDNLIPQEGDTIGIAYDHIELNFYLNGKNLEVPVLNIRGCVYPALFVDDGAILDIILDNFYYGPPAGFERIMIEQSLL